MGRCLFLIIAMMSAIFLAGCVGVRSGNGESRDGGVAGDTFTFRDSYLVVPYGARHRPERRASHFLVKLSHRGVHRGELVKPGSTGKIVKFGSYANVSPGDLQRGVLVEVVSPRTGKQIKAFMLISKAPPPWE